MHAIVAGQTGRSTATTPTALSDLVRGQSFLAIEVDELSSEVQDRLGLRDLRLVDRPLTAQTYEIAAHGDAIEIVVPIADASSCRPVYIVGTPDLVVTVRDSAGDFGSFADRVRWDAQRPGAVALFLFVELALRSFRASIREVRETLDDLEGAMLDGTHRYHLLALNDLHRRISGMRRALGEYGDAVTDFNDELQTNDSYAPEAVALARTHASAVSAVLGTLGIVRDEAANAMDLYRSLTSTRQGLVINRLTVVSGLLLPLTLITGFFGMNFGWLTDHTSSTSSFWLLGVAIPVAVAVTVVTLMWRAGWLAVLQAERSQRVKERRRR